MLSRAQNDGVSMSRSKVDIIDFEIHSSFASNRKCCANIGCDIFSLSDNLMGQKLLGGYKTTGAG